MPLLHRWDRRRST